MKTAFASNLIKYFELLAGITGIICFYKKRNSIWFAFAVFLVCLYGLEELGNWFGKNKMYVQNTNLYKWIVVPSLFIMYHIVYYTIAVKNIKRLVISSCILFLILALYENIFLGKEHFYSISLTISFGCISVLLFGLIYFFNLLKSNEILNFWKLMPFWFCLGLIIFYLGSFPYLTFFNSMAISKNRDAYFMYRWIFIFLNWVMYILFTIGFICSKQKH